MPAVVAVVTVVIFAVVVVFFRLNMNVEMVRWLLKRIHPSANILI